MDLIRGDIACLCHLLDACMTVILNILLYFLKFLLKFFAACHTDRWPGDIVKKISAFSAISYIHTLPSLRQIRFSYSPADGKSHKINSFYTRFPKLAAHGIYGAARRVDIVNDHNYI